MARGGVEAAPRFALGRWTTRASIAPAVLVAIAVGGTAASQGGYFPTSWGWSSIAFLWAISIWLVLSGRTDAGWPDLLYLGSLAALIAWVGLSITWSADTASSVSELERGLVLVAGCTAFAVVARRASVMRLALAIQVAIAAISIYGLATRLIPDRLGSFDPIAVYRLSDPIGYWNGLGVFATMGIVLGAGIAAAPTSTRLARAWAGASLVGLAVTLYYTYSRASWVALALGSAVVVAASPARRRLLASSAVLAVMPVVAVLLASHENALTHLRVSLPAAAHDGHRLAAAIVVISLVAAVLTLASSWVAANESVSRVVGTVVAAVVSAALVAGLAAALVLKGGPVDLVRRGYDSFVAPPTLDAAPNLNARLFRLAGNGRAQLWRYAGHTYARHSVLGTGAGTFEREWELNPKAPFKVRDAHGLYLETLAELGPIGLLLLLVALFTPVVAGIRVRRHPLAPAALGAYGAFLVHSGVDWDWELSGVTLTALLIGSLLLVEARSARPRVVGSTRRIAGLIAVVAAGGLAVFGLLGNSALAGARSDNDTGRFESALTQSARARRLMPWSPQPWIAQGEAQLGLGARAAARRSFAKAISIDSRDWTAWLDLALASDGRRRAQAISRARRLYPRSSEISQAVGSLARTTKG